MYVIIQGKAKAVLRDNDDKLITFEHLREAWALIEAYDYYGSDMEPCLRTELAEIA